MKPPHLIHLTSGPGELWHKDITVAVEPQEKILLWHIPEYQDLHYHIERPCPYCHGQYTDSPHQPAARVDCLHSQGEHYWWTTDICCQSCLEKEGLTTAIEVYLSQCGKITLVRRDVESNYRH